MATSSEDEMLDWYILDYMKKRNYNASAGMFMKEVKITKRPSHDGFCTNGGLYYGTYTMQEQEGLLMQQYRMFMGPDQLRTNPAQLLPSRHGLHLLTTSQQQRLLAVTRENYRNMSTEESGVLASDIRTGLLGDLSNKDAVITDPVETPHAGYSPQPSLAPTGAGLGDQADHHSRNWWKRKKPLPSGNAKDTGTCYIADFSFASAPLTSSPHTVREGMSRYLSRHNGMTKGREMDDSARVMGTSEAPDPAGMASLEDAVASYLSRDIKNADGTFHDTMEGSYDVSKVGSLCVSTSKVVSCHFSSDGKQLASAGHDKKVVLWDMAKLEFVGFPEEHTHIITDVRFKPNTSIFAASSFDSTVRLWDATEGGTSQVRFQPSSGQLLVVAADKVINVFDVKTQTCQLSLKGHEKDTQSICWNLEGDTLASASKDRVIFGHCHRNLEKICTS